MKADKLAYGGRQRPGYPKLELYRFARPPKGSPENAGSGTARANVYDCQTASNFDPRMIGVQNLMLSNH
jgi:hypothetical protein